MTLWANRFKEEPDREALAFTASLSFDRRLAPYDLKASRAHVKGLSQAGLLEADEEAVLLAALAQVEQELESGTFEFRETDEDIHTAIERRVTEIAGAVGAKLHTGRSRNDQVITALRLYLKEKVKQTGMRVVELAQAILDKAELYPSCYMPAYTHMQRAQPVLLSHYLLAHAWPLERDAERLVDLIKRLDVSPLGAGAVAGSSLPLQSDFVAAEMGFAARFENSIDAVAARDFVIEAAYVLCQIGLDLSRLAEEIVLFSTSEFNFIVLPDAYATGSSMLPQKKNPDVAELVRAKASRLLGNLVTLISLVKGLPLAYNRDLQEDKPAIFDSVDEVLSSLSIMKGLVEALEFNENAMKAAADNLSTVAVDLAEWLVRKGVAFREAHGIVAGLVRESLERRVPLEDLVIGHPKLGQQAREVLDVSTSVLRRKSPGSTNPQEVEAQKRSLNERLKALASAFS